MKLLQIVIETTGLTGLAVGCVVVAENLLSRKCVYCKRNVFTRKKHLVDTKQTICCVDCCVEHHDKTHVFENGLIKGTQAVRFYGCTEADLASLHNANLAPRLQQLYIPAEVSYLGAKRRREKLAELRETLDLHSVHWGSSKIETQLLVLLVADYIKANEPARELVLIKAKAQYLPKAREIMRICGRVHPRVALEYFEDYPDGSAEHFKHLRESMNKVFLLEGNRILHFLEAGDLQNLCASEALDDVYYAFVNRNSDTLLAGHLRMFFSPDVVRKIMADEGWREHGWTKGPEDRVACRLREYWFDRIEREELLKSALEKKGLEMPTNHAFLKDYLNGCGTIDVEEAVGVVDISNRMQIKGFDADSPVTREAQCQFLMEFRPLQLIYKEAIRLAMDIADQDDLEVLE